MRLLAGRRQGALALAAALFTLIFVVRSAASTEGDAVSFLYVLPVLIVAGAYGARAGMGAGLFASALAVGWALSNDIDLSPLGYAVRILVFVALGALAGNFATALRRLEAESSRHFELSHDLICVAGTSGYLKRVNPAFERVLGYTTEELLARPILDFVHPDDREAAQREIAKIADGGSAEGVQSRFLDRNGEVHWLEWSWRTLPEEGLAYAVARDTTERKRLEVELERLSQRDSLTGVFNRRRFDEELRAQLDLAGRYGGRGALLMIDLDRFKQINDRFGHAAGDEALLRVARALAAKLRRGDRAREVVARLGGDEFAALLPDVDEQGARVAAARLVDALVAEAISAEGEAVPIGVSVGIALYGPDSVTKPGELLAAADRAMYEAKAEGGGAVALAEPAGGGGGESAERLL